MDKEEKEIKKVTRKTTTTKKSSDKKAPAQKKTTKSTTKKTTTKPVKKEETKTAVKKTTTKKTTKPKTVKKEEKIEKVVELKEINEPVIEEKVITKTIPEKKVSSELLEIRKKRYIIEAVITAVLLLIALLFLCNRTFLKTNYKNDNINVDIPRFSYYLNDKGNKVKLLTLRKSDYLKEYYNEYLEGFVFYSCAEGSNTFYYDEETKTLIKEIKIEKKFAIKTIEITYDSRTPEEVCGLR